MPKDQGETTTYSRNIGFDLRQSYNAAGGIEYVGYAFCGALDSEAKWQIAKYGYDASNRLTARRYADGNDKYDKVWDDRDTAYTYIGL